jgi:hypothetical protein
MPFFSIIYANVPIAQNFGSPFGVSLGINNLVSLVLQIAIVVAGVILLFLLVGGGLKMIQGAGSSDPKATAGAHNAMTFAIAGFILILFAYIIIRIIETMVGSDFLTKPIGL